METQEIIKSDINICDVTNHIIATEFINTFGFSFEDFNEAWTDRNGKTWPASIGFQDEDGRSRAYYIDVNNEPLFPTSEDILSSSTYFTCCGDELHNLEDESLGLCPTCKEHV